MKLSLKIWLLAICYQVLIFGMMLGDVPLIALAFIPIGIIGGFPGLLIFDAIFKNLGRNNGSIRLKWCYLILTTIFSAVVSAAWPVILISVLLNHTSFEIMTILPATAAALVAVFTFTIPIHKALSANGIKGTTDLSTSNPIS